MRLVSRVEGWSDRGLWRFCWEEVRDAIADMKGSYPDDGRLIRALIAAREAYRIRDGLVESKELARARRAAKAFYAAIPGEQGSNDWLTVRWAAYAARATIMICWPNPEHYPKGFTAMAAAQIAHDMRNQNNAAHISVKWLGVHRIVRFLKYFDVGEPWELAMLNQRFCPDGSDRYAPINPDIRHGEPRVNFLYWETGPRAGEPIRTDFYEGANQVRAVQDADGSSHIEQDGVAATERHGPRVIMLDVRRDDA